MKGNTLAIVLLVVGLVVGAGAGYMLKPSAPTTEDGGDGTGTVTVVNPLEGQTIQIGYISSDTVGLETTQPLVQEILTPDYNEYTSLLGYDVEFEYLIDDATGQAAVHLEKVQGFKAMGINVFIGGQWSSQAQAALSYCNDNDMLQWSNSATSPLLSIANDNLFRMCPTDVVQAPAISSMLHSMDIEAVILIYRGDAWADGIVNYFEPVYVEDGGVILEKIRYAGESTEFSNYLQTAENIAKNAVAEYGADKVGVQIISFSEFVTMISQASDYETIYSLPWFGSDGTVLSQLALDDAPTQASHLKVYSTYAAPAESELFTSLYDRYYAIVSQPFGYYSACSYDIGWVLTKTILESQSTEATDLIPLQRPSAYMQWGSSGWCRLDEAGDRYASNYQIWMINEDASSWEVAGMYDSTAGVVTWYPEVLGFTPSA